MFEKTEIKRKGGRGLPSKASQCLYRKYPLQRKKASLRPFTSAVVYVLQWSMFCRCDVEASTSFKLENGCLECRHNSVDLSEPTILSPRVRVPSTTSTLLSLIVKFVPYLSCEMNESKQKWPVFGPFKKS